MFFKNVSSASFFDKNCLTGFAILPRLAEFMIDSLRKVSLKSLLFSLVGLGLLLASAATFITPSQVLAVDSINVWWPTNGAHVVGTQPFKAMVAGFDVSQYDMYWRVDQGSWNGMASNYADYPHKEASVDVTSWTWHGSGPYKIEYVARKNGADIASYSTDLYIDNGLPGRSLPIAKIETQTRTVSASLAPISIAPVQKSSGNPLANVNLYVDPHSAAMRQQREWQNSYGEGARLMQALSGASTATWFGNWNSNITQDVQTLVSKAGSQGSVPVLVAYNLPQRDCGGYSSGGSNSPDGYRSWIDSFASGIGSGKAIVILEPDALSQIGCLSSSDQSTRLSLLAYAVSSLKRNSDTKVYVDAGHSGWIDAGTMSDRLSRANVYAADGFALNVSNFMPTSDEVSYGTALSNNLNNKHFIVDTSRNGRGSNGEWCNPWGRAIGAQPTTNTGNSLVDAYLWLKVPGESDGNCNGGPSAGTWWPDYATSLVRNAW